MRVMSRHICFLHSCSELYVNRKEYFALGLRLFEDHLGLVNILAAG